MAIDSATNANTLKAPQYCRAQLNYAGRNGVAPKEVSIYNGRQAQGLSWETNGFELLQHKSGVTDWEDDAQLANIYYGEMVAEAKRLTGCRAAMISGHIARNPAHAKEHSDYAPIQYVHSDFTDTYGELIKKRYSAKQPFEMNALAAAGIELDDLLDAEHLMILQFWRNVGAEAMDKPLALCDASTVPREDLHAFHVPNYAGGDFPFDTYGVSAPPPGREHRWYVFPELAANEVVALRTFDSRRIGTDQPYWTPHTAFIDPNAPSAPPRFSVEVRATCLF